MAVVPQMRGVWLAWALAHSRTSCTSPAVNCDWLQAEPSRLQAGDTLLAPSSTSARPAGTTLGLLSLAAAYLMTGSMMRMVSWILESSIGHIDPCVTHVK